MYKDQFIFIGMFVDWHLITRKKRLRKKAYRYWTLRFSDLNPNDSGSVPQSERLSRISIDNNPSKSL